VGPLTGRVALVTGVSRRAGIGAALATRLAADGASLVLTGWAAADAEQPWKADSGGLESIAAEVTAAGAPVQAIAADLADPATPARLVATALERFGRLDAVVANHARSGMQTLEDLTATEIDLTLAVNTRATLLLVKEYAGAYQSGRPGGRVVLFTSGQYHGGMPAELPYVASKGALHQLTASLAVHLMPRGITVNCVDPGPNDTGYAGADLRGAVAARNPGGRWGTPADAARLVAWMVSDEAEWVTGQVIASDGGWSAAG
jgi:3-oxoacyl-[acyl-carrier protein] reductase